MLRAAASPDQARSRLTSIESAIWPPIGIGQRKVENGTLNMLPKPTHSERQCHSNALSVGRPFFPSIRALCARMARGFVATSARPGRGVAKVASALKNLAQNVASNSWASPKSNAVGVHAVDVIATGRRANVYNLTVEDCPEFYANGILVHNCDAFADAFNELSLGQFVTFQSESAGTRLVVQAQERDSRYRFEDKASDTGAGFGSARSINQGISF